MRLQTKRKRHAPRTIPGRQIRMNGKHKHGTIMLAQLGMNYWPPPNGTI